MSYNSQITTNLGLSPYEKVFNQKPQKPIVFTTNSSKNTQGCCQPTKNQYVIISHYIPTMKISFIIHKQGNKLPVRKPNGFSTEIKNIRKNTDMISIQKQLKQKNKKELNKQTSQNSDNKKITQTERKNRKIEEKTIPQDQNE